MYEAVEVPSDVETLEDGEGQREDEEGGADGDPDRGSQGFVEAARPGRSISRSRKGQAGLQMLNCLKSVGVRHNY